MSVNLRLYVKNTKICYGVMKLSFNAAKRILFENMKHVKLNFNAANWLLFENVKYVKLNFDALRGNERLKFKAMRASVDLIRFKLTILNIKLWFKNTILDPNPEGVRVMARTVTATIAPQTNQNHDRVYEGEGLREERGIEMNLIYIFYVRYGEIKEIPTRLSPRRLGGIGCWTDKHLLTHLVEGYRKQGGNGKWWTWRYWWDSFMKEIAALILIQMEESRVIYEITPYPGQTVQHPITDLRRQVKRSIDLFGGKEASGQFRYLIRHYKRMTDNSRIITSQIDRLAIWAQQAHAETEHYKYYLLLQVVEGQNGQAFLLGILIIILCFLAFGLALGATQASSISWGDVFSISGFGLAALSGLFALMALAQYLGLEDMNPGNPISRSASED
ncbi:hypothetical protein CLAIMM_12631 [Cladophialophora immunda]|nr:hypothetical protein CLAIMM_12631 [Cladophialophora immunda]